MAAPISYNFYAYYYCDGPQIEAEPGYEEVVIPEHELTSVLKFSPERCIVYLPQQQVAQLPASIKADLAFMRFLNACTWMVSPQVLPEGIAHELKGRQPNSNLALHLLKGAAEAGSALAQYNFGICNHLGKGVQRNLEAAVKLFTQAAIQGLPQAHHALGVCYGFGKGVPVDHYMEVRWYQFAANRGVKESLFNLATCYENSQGVDQNYVVAVQLYQLAAQLGSADALCNLGWCFEHGRGVPQDDIEAARLYKLAADKGSVEGGYLLGKCCENGKGVPQDYGKAEQLYRWAFQHGSELAQRALSRLLASRITPPPVPLRAFIPPFPVEAQNLPLQPQLVSAQRPYSHDQEVVEALLALKDDSNHDDSHPRPVVARKRSTQTSQSASKRQRTRAAKKN